jgi:DsbC/DsbD-like thiol-disulfide interchange protein
MKRIITFLLCVTMGSMAFSQVAKDPVTWTYVAKKKTDNTYDVIITATVAKPWHIYSATSPKGAGMPTKITIKKNPLISLSGGIKEKGKLEKEYDKNFEMEVKYYSDKVEFTQTITVKGKAKTNVSGTVEYMVCNNERCLPPTVKSFDIKL